MSAKKTTKPAGKTTKAPKAKPARAKTTKAAAPAKATKTKKAKVLSESVDAMTTKEMIEAMAAKNYWTSPGGATPHATLYSALFRELNTKGKDARFVKTERGKFAVKK